MKKCTSKFVCLIFETLFIKEFDCLQVELQKVSWQREKYTRCEPKPSAKHKVRKHETTYNHEGLWERLIDELRPVLNIALEKQYS